MTKHLTLEKLYEIEAELKNAIDNGGMYDLHEEKEALKVIKKIKAVAMKNRVNFDSPEFQEIVAKDFLRILGEWFKGGDPRGEGRDYPETLTAELVQNANDYFDANMAMDEAMTNNGIKTFSDYEGEQRDFIVNFFNIVWDKAISLQRIIDSSK